LHQTELDHKEVDYVLEFHPDIVFIIGHNGSMLTGAGYCIFFGGYEDAEEFDGIIVKEEEVEQVINHETLHCLLDSIGVDALQLENIWYQYSPEKSYLKGCADMGLGYQ